SRCAVVRSSFVSMMIGSLALAGGCSPGEGAPSTPDAGVAIDETSARPVDRDVVTLSRDERGRPALLRAGAPRPAPLGATAEEAARAHLDALAPLWVERRRAAAELTLDAARALRG